MAVADIGFQTPDKLESVHHRHHNIAHNHLDILVGQQIEGRLAV